MKRFLAILLSLIIMIGAVPTALAAETGGPTAAAAEAPEGYYGSRLTDPAAIAFYQALGTMDFTSDKNLSIEDPAVIEKAEAYAGGSDELIRSFGAAVDSFRYDHTEFFYVDWDMLSVNVGKRSGQYVVNIGTGRTDTYLRDKDADITGQVTDYNAALERLVDGVRAKTGADAAVKELAKAANDAVCDVVTYDFCDDENGKATEASKYIRTAYGALVNGRAVCEGYSRLYKAVLDELGIECELISGYYIDGEAFEPHMWNYVQNEDRKWYAVDVTMNDGHRLQTGGIKTTYDKYFWQTYEIFAVDHFENGIVSSVEYDMPYPELHRFWQTPTSSGLFESGYGPYGDKAGFWFSYDGKSAEDLKNEGLYMAFRTATTNTGTVRWSEWQTAEEMARIYQQGGVVSADGKTYVLMANKAMFAMEVGIFDTPEDVETVMNGAVVARKYSEEAVTSHLIEKMAVENPGHDPEYIAPTYIRTTEPSNLLQSWMDITKGTQHVELTYGDALREVGGGMVLEWGVSSYNRRDLSLESVRQYAKVENVKFDGDRTISFDITPSRMYNHNMISYEFEIKNMVNIIDEGKDGVALPGFSIGCRYEDDIACCKIFNDGRLYVNSYAQPTLVANSDLSMEGWTYKDTDGTQKGVSESQRSQMALVVTRPHNSEELVDETTKQIAGGADAIACSATYEIDLNICGKIVQIPNGSYMKLNLGIPDGFSDLMGKEDITFKLYHFKRIIGTDGTEILDYKNPEVIDCVLTPYGLIATVNSFSPYVLVAVDNSKLPAAKQDNSKKVALLCNGHGGRVEGSPAVSTLEEGENATYTLQPDAGYEVEFVHLNGKPLAITDNTITLTYDELKISNTLEVGFVATSVKAAETDTGVDNITPSASCTVTFHSNGGSPVAAAHVKSGSLVAEPKAPTRSGYSFDGWYDDQELTNAYDFSTPVIASIRLYAKWTPQGGGGSGSEPSQDTVVTILDSNYRKAYLFGKNDGLIHPKDPLTRAEAAAILYRLLDGDVRASVSGKDAPFADTPKDAWYYDEVAALYNLDIIHGKSAAAFDPNASITRAEFVTMCANLIEKLPEDVGTVSFNDLDGHWAKGRIEKVAALGWVSGVGGGKFVPNKSITRAEAVAVTNRILGRSIQSVDELGKDMKTWADNMDITAWYYLTIQAAGNDCG